MVMKTLMFSILLASILALVLSLHSPLLAKDDDDERYKKHRRDDLHLPHGLIGKSHGFRLFSHHG
jgi:hypothetical protein